MRRGNNGFKRKRPSEDKIAEDAKIIEGIQKRYAPQLRLLGKILVETGEKLVKLEEDMHSDAVKLTGDKNFELEHTVSFQEFGGSINDQLENFGEVTGVGFEDIRDMGESLVEMATGLLEETETPDGK